ncbi:MAG: nucleoside-diphosphate kinase [Elusimicrobia bacterium RIFCSPLOWO2_01_FULL_59_12]|nr:MAG: nucleoside-diphosphate kinase [Elusimicrobia bacterium RIFCSPLOWO2_01_FULL_59_12]
MSATAALQPTLILVKPDGLKKSLTGNILTKLAETRMIIVGAKVVQVSRELAEAHYTHLKDKPFFGELVRYIQGEIYGADYRRVLAMVYRGEDAIRKVRDISGATNPEEADSTSIRGSYGRITTKGVYENVIHASSSVEDAEREIKLWFKPDELVFPIYPTKTVIREKITEKVWA